jgi:hypothetical protein
MTMPPSSPAADRMRRSRQRRLKRLRCSVIELRATEVDALTRAGFLKPDMRNCSDAMIEARYQFLDRTLGFEDVTRNT